MGGWGFGRVVRWQVTYHGQKFQCKGCELRPVEVKTADHGLEGGTIDDHFQAREVVHEDPEDLQHLVADPDVEACPGLGVKTIEDNFW